MSQKKSHWTTEGKNPDYRFSLANERTFLAWIRTSFALLLGGVALEQFATGFHPVWIKTVLAVFMAITGSIMAPIAFFRWKKNEISMRLEQALAYTYVLVFISVALFLMSLVLMYVFVIGGIV